MKKGFSKRNDFSKKEYWRFERESSTKIKIPTRRQAMSFPTSKPVPQKNSNNDSKNEKGVSWKTGDPEQQIQIKDIIEFILKTMVTLSGYEKQLTSQFSLETMPTEM